MKLIQWFIESSLTPVLLHRKFEILIVNQAFSSLKNANQLTEMGLQAWLELFFHDTSLLELLTAIKTGAAYKGILQGFSTGVKVIWQVHSLSIPQDDQNDMQVTFLCDCSKELLQESYWQLYIKMNEATFTLQRIIEERTSALKRAEAAEKQAKFLSSIPEISPLPILRLNKEKIIVYQNTPAQILIDIWQSQYNQLFPSELFAKIDNVLNTGIPDTFEWSADTKTLLFNLTKININEDYIDLFGLDITAHKALEKDNEEKKALLAHAGRLVALGEMATGVAHELNQPLSIIHTNLQSLGFIESLTSQDITEIVESSLTQIHRATKIIEHMRSFARFKQPNNVAIDLVPSIDAALNMFSEQFRLHGIEINCHYAKNLPLVRIEPQQMEQLVANLLSNARYAVEKKKEESDHSYKMQIDIYLNYLPNESRILFEVKDNGIGMSEETLDKCLNPFFTTKPVGEGTGIGLSIINSILTNLGGSIHVESKLHEGTKIIILLPITKLDLANI